MDRHLAPTHFDALDSWRGICAILVATLHFTALGHVFELPLVRHAYLFVDFFFVLSGFVIAHATIGPGRAQFDIRSFLIKRIGRLAPLHFTVLGLFVALEAAKWILMKSTHVNVGQMPFEEGGYRSLSAIPVHIFMLQGMHVGDKLTWNFPSWSISSEFWTYCVFGIVAYLAPRRTTGLMVVLGALSVVVLTKLSVKGIETTNEFGFFRCIYGFSAGVLTYAAYRSNVNFLKSRHATIAELLLVGLVVAFVWYATPGLFSLTTPLLFAVCVYVFSFQSGAISWLLLKEPLVRLGRLSFSIYMFHAFVLALVMSVALVTSKATGVPYLADREVGGEILHVITNVNPFLLDGMLVGYLALVVAGSVLTRRWIEIPGQRVAAGWALRFKNAKTATGTVGAVAR